MSRSAINLRHYAALVVLRSSESLDQAAKALCLTRSALSRQLRDLEEEFGGAVFDRHSSPVRLTPLGMHLAELGYSIQKLIFKAHEKSKDLSLDAGDKQYFSATRSTVPSAIPKSVSELPAFLSQKPNVAAATVEFFTKRLGNKKTRIAYARALSELADWCDRASIGSVETLTPKHIHDWVNELNRRLAVSSVRVYLAAVRMLFNWLVQNGALLTNPAKPVRLPAELIAG